MPATVSFFAQPERKKQKGVYRSKKPPYNLLSLLIAEPRNKAEVL